MTNVTWEKFTHMVEYKRRESKDNLEIIFDCINEFDNPVSAKEILQRLDKIFLDTAKRDAQEKYERGEIMRSGIDKYISKNKKRISLRTVQRALNTLGIYGSVQESAKKYSITKKGQRELMFKQFAQGYG